MNILNLQQGGRRQIFFLSSGRDNQLKEFVPFLYPLDCSLHCARKVSWMVNIQ